MGSSHGPVTQSSGLFVKVQMLSASTFPFFFTPLWMSPQNASSDTSLFPTEKLLNQSTWRKTPASKLKKNFKRATQVTFSDTFFFNRWYPTNVIPNQNKLYTSETCDQAKTPVSFTA